MLLVREKGSSVWTFPQGVRKDGEKMVEAARRSLHECYGPNLVEWYPGNAPMGYWLDVYDSKKQAATGTYGAKVSARFGTVLHCCTIWVRSSFQRLPECLFPMCPSRCSFTERRSFRAASSWATSTRSTDG